MKMSKLFTILLFCFCGTLTAQDAHVDVPPVAEREIEKLGNHVQELGTIQAGPADAISEALATPADDSDRWFLTNVFEDGKPASQKLVYDFGNAKQLRSWADDSHYHTREAGSDTQKHWLNDSLKEKIMQSGGYPAVVIQPPRNGKYGPNSTIVGVCGGYDGNPANMSARIRAKVTQYLTVLSNKGLISSSKQIRGGHAQVNVIGAPAPFNVRKPTDLPFGPELDYPNLTPPRPAELSIDDIRKAAPGAPNDFVLKQLESKASDSNAVAMQWLQHQLLEKNKPAKVDDLPDTPEATQANPQKAPGESSWLLLSLLGLLVLVSIVGVILMAINLSRSGKSQQSQRSNTQQSSSTEQDQALKDALLRLQKPLA